MALPAGRDFAALLDDLVAASDEATEEMPARPSIPFDYLAVADDRPSGRVTVADTVLEAEYGDTAADDVSAFLFEAANAAFRDEREDAVAPSTDPEAIALELGLDRQGADLGKVRRRFAFANHPDRVAPHLRERASARMQVANMLIDDAERG